MSQVTHYYLDFSSPVSCRSPCLSVRSSAQKIRYGNRGKKDKKKKKKKGKDLTTWRTFLEKKSFS